MRGGRFPSPSWRCDGRCGAAVAADVEAVFVHQARTLRWLLAASRAPSNLLARSPYCLAARAVVGANAWRERVSSASPVLAAIAPLCCAREPRRTILRRTTFLFSSGGQSPEISMQTLILIIHFPQKTLDEKYKKLYSLKADHSPLRCTREGARQREQLRRKILVLGFPRYQRLPQLLRGPWEKPVCARDFSE